MSADASQHTRPSIGGQAVLEGVMMRGPRTWSVACRRPDSTIAVDHFPLPTIADRVKWLKWPLIRGCFVLGESLAIGLRALMISANHAIEEEDQLSDRQLVVTLTVSMTLFFAIFIAVPVFGARLVERGVGNLSESNPLLFNIVEGGFRLGLFIGYLLAIGLIKDVRRLFQYHGAEHKTIYAYENGDALVPQEIDSKYPTLHVRCGTNFLFIVLFMTMVAHFAIDLAVAGAGVLPRLGLRLGAIPLLAGISYEAIKLASRNEQSLFFRVTMLPGLALQRITTKPPSLDQIEVAIAAMEAVTSGLGDKPTDAPEAPEAPVS